MTRGGEAEFTEFVTIRYAALLQTACLLAGDRATGEDLLQTALTKTYLSWHRIRRREAAEAYVRRVLARTATSWWRRPGRREEPTADPPEPPARVDEPGGLTDPVWDAVRGLPVGQRAVLVLRFHADLTEAETARTLGVSVGTVKSQTARALGRLRAELSGTDVVDRRRRG
ncbi:MAG TPA: SigE family RNA polymerase sigma factor [Pseudonocardiaceae bacterium]